MGREVIELSCWLKRARAVRFKSARLFEERVRCYYEVLCDTTTLGKLGKWVKDVFGNQHSKSMCGGLKRRTVLEKASTGVTVVR